MRPLFKPYQLLLVGDNAYVIAGVYIGIVGQETLIGICPAAGSTFANGMGTSEVMVPEPILRILITDGSARLYENVIPLQQQLEVANKALRNIAKHYEDPELNPIISAQQALKEIEALGR